MQLDAQISALLRNNALYWQQNHESTSEQNSTNLLTYKEAGQKCFVLNRINSLTRSKPCCVMHYKFNLVWLQIICWIKHYKDGSFYCSVENKWRVSHRIGLVAVLAEAQKAQGNLFPQNEALRNGSKNLLKKKWIKKNYFHLPISYDLLVGDNSYAW